MEILKTMIPEDPTLATLVGFLGIVSVLQVRLLAALVRLIQRNGFRDSDRTRMDREETLLREIRDSNMRTEAAVVHHADMFGQHVRDFRCLAKQLPKEEK